MNEEPRLVQGRPSQEEAKFLLSTDKTISANLMWMQKGRRYVLEANVLVGFALKVGFDAKVPRLMQKSESYMPNPTPLAVTTRQCS